MSPTASPFPASGPLVSSATRLATGAALVLSTALVGVIVSLGVCATTALHLAPLPAAIVWAMVTAMEGAVLRAAARQRFSVPATSAAAGVGAMAMLLGYGIAVAVGYAPASRVLGIALVISAFLVPLHALFAALLGAARQEGSFDALDRAAGRVGIALFVVIVGCQLCFYFTLDGLGLDPSPSLGAASATAMPALAYGMVVLCEIGAMLFSVAAEARLDARRRWLDAVAEGKVRTHRLVPPAQAGRSASIAALDSWSDAGPPAVKSGTPVASVPWVLVRVDISRDASAYREGEQLIALGRVSRPADS